MDFRKVILRWNRYLGMARTYPPLFHCTSDEAILTLLKSKSLFARPAWDFEDTEEYMLGLQLAARALKCEAKRQPSGGEISQAAHELIVESCGERSAFLSRTIELVETEIERIESPNVKVYVTCFTTRPGSRMKQKYGSASIRFNAILPVLAYQCPQPFTGSMLSWVCYSEDHYLSRIITLGVNDTLEGVVNNEPLSNRLYDLSPPERIEALAEIAAEGICNLAPNIKAPSFEFEEEWRLKSIQSSFVLSGLLYQGLEDREPLPGFPRNSSQTSHEPSRYHREITYNEKFLSDGVDIEGGVGNPIAEQVMEWMRHHQAGFADLNAGPPSS